MSLSIVNNMTTSNSFGIIHDYQVLEEEEETITNSHIWFINLILELANWMKSKNLSHNRLESLGNSPSFFIDIGEGWEWVFSDLEEKEQLLFQRESNRIKEELGEIQNSSSLNFRSYFISLSSHTIGRLTAEEISLLGYVLDPCKSTKIVSDVIHKHQDNWLLFVKDSIFLDISDLSWESFQDSYHEKPYQKNLVGALKELAGAASMGRKDVGIDQKIMADILWSIWKTLSSSLKITLGREMTRYELTCLASEISKCQEDLISLWIHTVQISKSGTSKAGVVIQKWSIEEELKRKAIQVKLSQGVDAKWQGGKTNFKQEINSNQEKSVKEIRKELLSKLSLTNRKP